MSDTGRTMLKPGYRLPQARRAKLKEQLVALIEQAARNGQIAPTNRPTAKMLQISEKTGDGLFNELRKEGRISWRTVQTGPKGMMRIITVTASGLTTAEPEQVKARPRPSRAKVFQFRKLPPLQQIGISDRQLYGTLDESVKVLRHRGYVVFRERGGVRVGNALLSFDELAAKAAREARLMGWR